MRIRTKMILGFIVPVVLLLILGVTAYLVLIKVISSTNRIHHYADKEEVIHNLQLAVDQLLMPPNDYLIHGDVAERQNFNELQVVVDEKIIQVEGFDLGRAEKEKLENIKLLLAKVKSMGGQILQIDQPVKTPFTESQLMEKMDAQAYRLLHILNGFHEVFHAQGVGTLKRAHTLQRQMNYVIVTISLACLLASLVVAVIISHRLTQPIIQLASAAQIVGQGDLNHRLKIKTNDEIGLLGQNFNQMIGDLKRSREQIELYNPILRQMARERTAAHDQLLQVSKLATIGQLAVGVSHELNTLLAGILSYSQFILKTGRNKKLENLSPNEFKNIFTYGNYIERGSQRCKTIVANLLKFSRASKTQIAPLSVNQILEETFILTRHQLQMQQVELARKFAPDLPPVRGDEHQLQQVFTNIMLNAQAAMPEGGKLTVSTTLNDGLVQIAFADTGCGIPKEHLDKLFDPFSTTKEAGESTGLELSASYGIIQAYQGKIEVASEVGKGTTFRIKLPREGSS